MTDIAIQNQSQPEVREAGRQEIQLACFRVGDQLYGLDILRIREIVRPQKLRPVPKAPSFVEGVMNLRGAVIPVVDLRRRFDLVVPPEDRQTRIMISALAGRIVGLMVDEVVEVRRYSRKEIQPAPHFLKGRGVEFFLGVCRREEDLILILDLEKLLSTEEKFDVPMLSQPLPDVPGEEQ
jgi:purine-binding chemotaxis protein CheW